MSKSNRDTYWASVPTTEIADEILSKCEDYYTFLRSSGRMQLYRRSYEYYYRPKVKGARLNASGNQNELTTITVNQYRNLLVHLETMTSQQRAVFEPKATNTDAESQAQTILATGLLEYYSREKKMERFLKQSLKDSLIFGEGFVMTDWEAGSGEIYSTNPETGTPIYEGDVAYNNYTPLTNIRDVSAISAGFSQFNILVDFLNKHDLVAQNPELKEKILSDSMDPVDLMKYSLLNSQSTLMIEGTDRVPVYTLRHKKTPALPNGRLTKVLGNGTVLFDGPLPFRDSNIRRIAPDEETGTIFGYTVGFDLLPVQEAIDMLYSTVITNQATFGVQNIMMPKGHDIGVTSLGGGLNLIEYDQKLGKPEPLNLTQTPPEIFNFLTQLERLAETLSGVNSVARGNPEASLKSGAALALVQSMAIQFSMGLQQSWAQLVEDVGTDTIMTLQDFAAVPRVALIAGKSNRTLMKQFTGKDLSLIKRVTVDMGNPIMKTTAGKLNMADVYLQNQMIENPDQYSQVVATGRLEPAIEGKQANNLNIKSENEGLQDGVPQIAIITDNHKKHIFEHSAVLASPGARRDPKILEVTLAHIQEHLNLWQTAPPALLMALHEEMAPPPPPGPAGQPGAASQAMNQTPPVVQEAQGVNMPNMPSPPPGTDERSQEVIAQQQPM